MKRALLLALLAACGPTLVWHGKSPDRARDLRVVEQHGQFVVLDGKRGPTYDGISIGALAFSPDSTRLAYAAKRGGTWRVVSDGREGPPFQGIGSLTFSRDSHHLAYSALQGRSWVVVLDGTSGPKLDGLLADGFVFSNDGAHFAYGGILGTGYHAVIDGVVGPRFDGVGDLAFSADGAHAGYVARRGKDAFAVVDGQLGAAYRAIDVFAFAPTGGRHGYIARDRDGWHAVVDGVAGPAFDLVRGLAFSADGTHVAYVARREQGDTFVVVDGVEGPHYAGIRPATLTFARGQAQPSYVAQRDFRFFAIHAGKEGVAFDDIGTPVYGADGHWAYVGELAGKDIVVIDGVEQKPEMAVVDLAIAPRGSLVAYVAQRGARTEIRIGARAHRFDLVLAGTLVFDPTGTHWGCIAGVRAERKMYVVVDGRVTGEVSVDEAIDLAIQSTAARRPLDDGDRVLRDWVAAEVARSAR